MGFRCDITGKHIQGKPHRVVARMRRVIYPPKFNPRGEMIQRGGEGDAIEREINVDPTLTSDQLKAALKQAE
jgi:hypothetical protein